MYKCETSYNGFTYPLNLLLKFISCRSEMEFPVIVFSAFFVFQVLVPLCPALASPNCDFPVIFNFGDSNSDTGAISAAFEPLGWPYGDVFFNKPSGRDCDGRLIIDFIAERLRLPFLSAYLNSLGANFRHGANFATGGSTVRKPNETIYEHSISPFFLDMQVTQFEQFKARSNDLYKQAKNPSDRDKLTRPEDFSKALYTIDIGQNDLAIGFRKMSIDQLRAALPDIVNQFASAVERIYKLGGRSFWIHNTGPFGCMPVNQFYNLNPAPGILDEHGCIKAQNDISMELNNQLKVRLDKLRVKLQKAAITYVDVYAAKYSLISNGKTQGFTEPLKACCGYHVGYDHVWCATKAIINGRLVFGDACENKAQYVSWDGVHYSEAANHFVANYILNGSLSTPPIPITQACHRR